MSTAQISIELDRSVLSAMRQAPPNFAREMRLAAAKSRWCLRKSNQTS